MATETGSGSAQRWGLELAQGSAPAARSAMRQGSSPEKAVSLQGRFRMPIRSRPPAPLKLRQWSSASDDDRAGAHAPSSDRTLGAHLECGLSRSAQPAVRAGDDVAPAPCLSRRLRVDPSHVPGGVRGLRVVDSGGITSVGQNCARVASRAGLGPRAHRTVVRLQYLDAKSCLRGGRRYGARARGRRRRWRRQ